MLPQAVSNHYRAQQRLMAATLLGLRREWSRMGDDLDGSWASIGPRLVALTAAAQAGAAFDGAAYVPEALDQQGIEAREVRVVAARFAGAATSLDGRAYGSLSDLLYGAVVHARAAPVSTLPERLAVGEQHLVRLVHTQVSDAARQSAGAVIAATPNAGWTRMVNPPSCKDCAVLAGKWFKFNQGFQRHPRCDCRHVPTTEANWRDVGMSIDTKDITNLTDAERKALDEGADLGRVVNAQRGRSANRMTTSELAKRGRARLTPEGIYRVSATREEAIQRLIDNGYIR